MNKGFRRWLSSRFFSNLGKQIQVTVIAWQIYKLTGNPLALGLIGLSEAIPFIGIALWAGHMVDHGEKRSFIMGAQVGLLLGALALLSFTFLPKPPLFLFYLATAWYGFCSSFENISTNAYAQLLISKESYPKAMGWNLGFFQTTVIAGPPIAGWLLTRLDPRPIYGIVALLLATSIACASLLSPIRTHNKEEGELESGLGRVKNGLKFIWTQPRILSAMSLDMVAVLFGDVVALYPFFAVKLGAGSIGFGFLKAATGIGSGLVSAVQAVRPFVRRSWTALRAVVFVFGLCIVCFSLSPNIYLAVLFLMMGGAADGVSVIIRQTTYQALTPDHLRGRVAAVSSMFIWTSNEIGAFESGLLARFAGVVPSAVIGGFICMASVFVMTKAFQGKINENVA